MSQPGNLTTQTECVIISEDATLVQWVRAMLTQEGFDLSWWRSPAELEAQGAPPLLAICDDRSIEQDWSEWLRALKSLNPLVRLILIGGAQQTDPAPQSMTRHRILAHIPDEFAEQDLLKPILDFFAHSPGGLNRRSHRRYQLALDTHCILINPFTGQENRPLAALIRDISRSGVSMLVRQLFPVPCMMRLVVEWPNRRPITMLAKSMSCTLTQIPDVYRLGAKFVGLLPPELEEAIGAFNQKQSSEELDIFMGKTFKQAVEEWIRQNQDLVHLDEATPLPQLIDEVCKAPNNFD